MENNAGFEGMDTEHLGQLSRPGWLILFAVVTIAALGGAALAGGGLYLGLYEGDAVHLADIVLRMADGQWPHLDFMSPLGVLAGAPIALFVGAGWGLGHAVLLAQILVAAILAPAAVHAALTRLGGPARFLFVGYVLLLCLALVHGEEIASVAVSMHYNRWAWAVSYIVLLIVLVKPAGHASPRIDGVLVGLGCAALALIKMTYFAAFAPVVLVALVMRRWWVTAAFAVVSGLAVAAVLTALAGVGFWLAYLSDLATVAASSVRDQPGAALSEILSGPPFLAVNMALLGAIVLLRHVGRMTEGILLLLLYFPFAYVTYQNFGNDPQWVVLVAVTLFALWPAVADERIFGLLPPHLAILLVGILAGAGYGSVHNMLASPLYQFGQANASKVPVLGDRSPHTDFLAGETRMFRPRSLTNLDGPGWRLPPEESAGPEDKENESGTLVTVNGEALAYCELNRGISAWLMSAARDLEENGYAGKGVISADIFGAFWLFGDLRPVHRGAPWYYGKLPGIADADYVLIPTCPVSDRARRVFLQEIAKSDWALTEVRRTPLYILMEISASVSDGKARDAR